MLIPMLLALSASPAQASSDIEFKTTGPVLIYVDGQQAQLTSKLKQKVEGLEAGDHEIKVTGVFGKTLFEADINLPDNTITQAEWSGGELEVLSTDWLSDDEEVAEAEPEEEEELVAEAPEEEEPEELALAVPVEEAPPAAEPELEVEEAVALPRPQAAGRTLTVQASEGMRVEVVHEGQVVTVVVKDGAFQIEDPSGLQLALSR
jgi:hypothetical protein